MIKKGLLALLLAACAAMAAPCSAVELKASEIHSITKGILDGSKDKREIRECSSFTMTRQEVVLFFKRAKIVPEARVHDLYWSACYVGGTALADHKMIRWQINALGAATIEWPDARGLQYFYEGEPPGMK